MDGIVFIKTPAGLEEIQNRRLRLHPRARSLLIMIDGRQSVFELISSISGVGVGYEDHQYLKQLEGVGLIMPRPSRPDFAQLPTVASPLSEPGATYVGGAGERLSLLYQIYVETTQAHFPERAAAFKRKLDQAVDLREFILLGNEIIVALNRTQRVEQAIAFKTRVKPLLS